MRAQVPSLMPPGFRADLSAGIEFLFRVIITYMARITSMMTDMMTEMMTDRITEMILDMITDMMSSMMTSCLLSYPSSSL